MTAHTIAGAANSDTITGFATGDTITVTSPYTTGGYLTLSLADSNVTVDLATTLGAAGTAIVTGGAGSDSITGGNGNDSLSGGNGNDMNPDGNDTLTGGAGSDTFNVSAGTDTITDWTASDTLNISWATARIAVTDLDAFATNSGIINNNGGTLVLDGSQPATVAQALAVRSALPSGAFTFTAGISDVVANYNPVDPTAAMQVTNVLIASQSNITVTDAVTVAQATNLDSPHSTGTLTLAAGLSDTIDNYFVWNAHQLATGFAALLATNSALAVTITGDPVIIEVAKAIDDATTGALTITAGISDTCYNFFSDYDYPHYGTTLAPGVAALLATNPNVTVAGNWVSIAELKAIDDLTTGTVTSINTVITGEVTIAQLTAITQNYHTNNISFNAVITDTAANLATHNADGTWTVNPFISEYQPYVNVSGAIDPAEVTALKNAGAWVLWDTSLSAPNTYVIETASTPELWVTTNMVANVVDAAGDQMIWINEQHGKLNLSGTVGHNVIGFNYYSAADDTWNDGQLEVSRSGGTVIFADHSTHEQIASIETNANAPSQTIKFGDGPGNGIELTFNGSTVALDGVAIPVIGDDVLLVGINLPTIDTWWSNY